LNNEDYLSDFSDKEYKEYKDYKEYNDRQDYRDRNDYREYKDYNDYPGAREKQNKVQAEVYEVQESTGSSTNLV